MVPPRNVETVSAFIVVMAQHTYADNGEYIVILTIEDNNSESDSDADTVNINNANPHTHERRGILHLPFA